MKRRSRSGYVRLRVELASNPKLKLRRNIYGKLMNVTKYWTNNSEKRVISQSFYTKYPS